VQQQQQQQQQQIVGSVNGMRHDMGVMRHDMGVMRHDMGVMRKDINQLNTDMICLQNSVMSYTIAKQTAWIAALEQEVAEARSSASRWHDGANETNTDE
jgi:hypothetical protein